MDGKYLNRFIEWIDLAISSEDLFYSEDIDYFVDDSISKKGWLLFGLSLWTLAKDIVKSRGLDYIVELGLTLDEIKTPHLIPKKITDQLFKKVSTPPKISIFKNRDYILQLYEDSSSSSFREVSTTILDIPLDCRIFYYESKVTDSNNILYYRCLFII